MSEAPAAHSIYPDAVDSLPVEFRIDGELGVRAVLRDLSTRKVSVSLYPNGRLEDFVVTQVAHVDENGVEFELADDPAALATIASSRSIAAVAFPGSVKTQFVLAGFELLDSEVAGTPVLRAPIPALLYRIQRRDAFRVVPPVSDEARCVRRDGAGSETAYPIVDLSAGGAAVLAPADAPPPRTGEHWPHSRIETIDRVIPCGLLVRHVDRHEGADGGSRIGLQFDALPSEIQRQVQLYVIDIDRRMRRKA
ncbi:MAG TPA: flagellar brake protein [Burkholderiaceae bacterium]|nr:flagellar brake protein [Burkholderiaceae bacterium]